MSIDVTCQNCSKRYRLNDELEGRKFKCKGCGEVVVATTNPTRNSPAVPKSTDVRPAARSKKSSRSAASGTKPASARDNANPSASPAPAKKKRSAKKKQRPAPDPYADDYQDAGTYGAVDDFGDGYADAYDDYGSAGETYDDYNAPPPKKKKKKKSTGKAKSFKEKPSGGGLPAMTFNLNRMNIGLVIVGGILIFMGFREFRLASKSGSTPKEISLAELYANGPGTDIYLTVTGVVPASDGYVANETKYGSLSEIWFACVPEGGATSSKFILYSTNAHTEDAATSLMDTSTHTGMLINSVKGLDSETKTLLKRDMPGIELDKAYVFQEGRTPAGFLKYSGLMLAGLVLMLIGLGWIFFLHQ